jgi:dTDP-4-amino-4,6-dideoxygalactose transaminase
MTSLTWDRHQGHAYSYDVVDLGYNYRIDEIHSALGLVQLSKLKANNLQRRDIVRRYRLGLADSGVGLPFAQSSGTPAYHLFPILLPEGVERKRFIDRMREAGVQTSIHYPPVHQFSYYQSRYLAVSLPLTEAVAAREVTLPLYPTMKDADVEIVLASVRESLM